MDSEHFSLKRPFPVADKRLKGANAHPDFGMRLAVVRNREMV